MKMIRSRNTLLISVMIFSEIRWGLSQRMPLIPLTVLIRNGQPIKISVWKIIWHMRQVRTGSIFPNFLQKEIIWIPMKYIRLLQIIWSIILKKTPISQNFYISICFRRTPFPEARSVWCCMNREFYQKMMAVTRHWPPAPWQLMTLWSIKFILSK